MNIENSRYSSASEKDVSKSILEIFNRIDQTRKGIYLFGAVGVGKTHTAFALFNSEKAKLRSVVSYGGEKVEVFVDPLLWNVSELFHELRLDFDRTPDQKKHIEDRIMRHKGILFLDDIGSEKVTDWVLETFYLIINSRYNNLLPIIFTSNFSLSEVAERLGERIASRIMGSCDIIHLDGKDRRCL